ncbi:MAG: hypothetical protein AAF711_15600 [Planctomycetota bacterium]
MSDDQVMRILYSLFQLVVVSMVLERALAFIFEHRWFREYFEGIDPDNPPKPDDPNKPPSRSGYKGLLAIVIAIFICWIYKFDIMQDIFAHEKSSALGVIITGFVLAGGSAGAITLFQGVLRMSKENRDAMRDLEKAKIETEKQLIQKKAELELMKVEARKKIIEAGEGADEGGGQG